MSCMSESYVPIEDDAFVFPLKTKLNSSTYIYNETNNDQSIHLINEDKSRKICNESEIPSYKGFSIAQDTLKGRLLLHNSKNKSKLKGDIIRKISKRNNDEENVVAQKRKKTIPKKQIIEEPAKLKHFEPPKPVDSFWIKDGAIKGRVVTKMEMKNNNKSDEKRKPKLTKEDIKKYIEEKRENEKKMEKQKRENEMERLKRVEENLNHLSQKCKSNIKKPIISRNKIINENNSISDNSLQIDIELNPTREHLNDWKPLKNDELTMLDLNSKDTIEKYTENTQFITNLGRRVEQLNQKLKNYEGSIEKDFVKKTPQPKYQTQTERKPGEVRFIKNLLEACSESSRSSVQSSSSRTSFETPSKSSRSESLVDRIHPIVKELESKVERKVETNSQIAGDPEIGELIKKLTEETQNRYEDSKRSHQIWLRQNGIIPMKEQSRKMTEKELFTEALKQRHLTDPLRFINIYKQKQKQQEQQKNMEKEQKRQIQYEEEKDKRQIQYEEERQQKINSQNSEELIRSEKEYLTSNGRSSTIKQKSLEKIENISINSSNETIHDSSSFEHQSVSVDIDNDDDDDDELEMTASTTSSITDNRELRYSPRTLESHFLAALHHEDALSTGYMNLLETERLQDVSMAQQETVCLAQLLKARDFELNRRSEQQDELNKRLTEMKKQHVPQKRLTSTTTTTTESSSSTDKKPVKKPIVKSVEKVIKKKKKESTTESDASEIEELIVDEIPSKIDEERLVSSEIPEELPSQKENTISKDSDKEKSIEEIITTPSTTTRTPTPDGTDNDISTAKSLEQKLKDDSSIKDTSEIKDEIITSKSSSTTIQTTGTTKTKSKTKDDYSMNTFVDDVDDDNSKSQSLIISNQSLIELADMEKRILALEREKSIKQSTLLKLNKKLKYTSYQKQEQRLSNQIDILNNQIKSVEKEIDDLNTSASIIIQPESILEITQHNSSHKQQPPPLSPSKKSKLKSKTTQQETLPSHHSSTTSSSTTTSSSSSSTTTITTDNTISKGDEIKTEIITENVQQSESSKKSITKSSDSSRKSNKSINDSSKKSITKTSDSSKKSNDSSKSSSHKKSITSNKESDKNEVDTARSIKQLQFGDINEEFSASDHNEHELISKSSSISLNNNDKVPSISSSQQQNYPVLELDQDLNNDIDKELGTARTIHSEISEIPEECDFDDDDDDDSSKSKKIQNNDDGTEYTEDFTESKSQKEKEETSSSSSSSSTTTKTITETPEAPPRKHSKKNLSSPRNIIEKDDCDDDDDDDIEEINNDKSITGIVNNVSEHILKESLSDVMKNIENKKKVEEESEEEEIEEEEDEEEEEEEFEIEKSANESKDPTNQVPKLYENELDDINETLDNNNGFKLATSQQILLTESLMKIDDKEIKPLMEEAIDYLFELREQNRQKSTGKRKSTLEVFEMDINSGNIPPLFQKKNDTQLCLEIYSTTVNERELVHDLRSKYIPRVLLYRLITDIVKNIYELENICDEPERSRQIDLFPLNNSNRRNSKFKLWRGSNEPNTKADLLKIVHDELCQLQLLSTNYDGSKRQMKNQRTKIQNWCIMQQTDFIDSILVDEIFREDSTWYHYDYAEAEVRSQFAKQYSLDFVAEQIENIFKL